jgi:hypothetical protein
MAKTEAAKMTVEELNLEIAQVELETKRLMLAEQKKRNADFTEAERSRHEANQKRMDELTNTERNKARVISTCRHRSGGTPANLLRGGGRFSFSLITRAVMPDGKTILLQCPRCRMMKYPPTKALKDAHPGVYLAELTEYNRLLQMSVDEGIEDSELRGPTFLFENAQGVPFIPERV